MDRLHVLLRALRGESEHEKRRRAGTFSEFFGYLERLLRRADARAVHASGEPLRIPPREKMNGDAAHH